jgi:hypothetical protein
MQHHSISRHILQLEQHAADLLVSLALVQPADGRAQVQDVRRDLDAVLLALREAHGQRAHLLETLGMPPVLGWSNRSQAPITMTTTTMTTTQETYIH